MNIRPAAAADLDRVLAIQESLLPAPGSAGAGVPPPLSIGSGRRESRPDLPLWTREHFLHELGSERSYFVVLEEGGEIRGYGGIVKVPPEAQITMIAVAPEWSRRGLGRGLLGHLLEAARAAGCPRVGLEVSSANAPALALYRSRGFAVVGRRPKFYNGRFDAILMDLNLP